MVEKVTILENRQALKEPRPNGILWGPIGEEVYKRTYSRLKPDGKQETWQDTAERVVDGNLGLVQDRFREPGEREKLFELLYRMKMIPGGRHLWATGVPGRQYLSNCFSGETLVLTEEGVFPIRDLAGKEIKVLSMGKRMPSSGYNCATWKTGVGVWRKAAFKSFGKQHLFRVTFSDGTHIEATGNHRWYVSKRKDWVVTSDLKGHDVPFVPAPKPTRNVEYVRGVLHGFTYGDGALTQTPGCTTAHVSMFGGKHEAMEKLFESSGYEVTRPKGCDGHVGRLPRDWKNLPSAQASPSYWLGFICGFLAADGTVDKKGSVFLYQSDREMLDMVRWKAAEVGFVATEPFMQRRMNPWTGEESPCWRIALRRFSVDPDDLILDHHRQNFEAGGESSTRGLRVVNIEDTGREEEVFCAVEPETHTFVLGNGLLTGNCHSAGWSRRELTEHFTFTFEELLKGGGVGSNYSNRYIEIYPPVFSAVDLHIVSNLSHPDVPEFEKYLSRKFSHLSRERFVIEDSREGWSAALAEVLRSAWYGRETPLVIDVSMLRERGAILRSFGGKSSGPAPLVEMLTRVAGILNSKVGTKLSSLDMMEIDHEISRVVVAGGIRRSARMSIKHWADRDIVDFIHAKIDKEKLWTTNISVEVDDEFFRAIRKSDKHATMVLHEVAIGMHRDGEPGLWNSSLSSIGELERPFSTNPCGEIAFGMWDICCLGHINLDQFAGQDAEAQEAFRLMTRFLIRATFGDIANPLQKDVISRNRRIGVGFFGYANWITYQGVRFSESHHNQEIRRRLRSFRDVCRKEAREYAFKLRIPEPIKVTCIAPTGTISNLPGVTSGCQPIFARYFRRRVRYAEKDENLKNLAEKGFPIETSLNEPSTQIVSFFCKDPLIAECERRKIDLSLIEEQSEVSLSDHLAVQSMLQQEYADNAISYTINFDPKKVSVEEVEKILRVHLPHLKGTTLMPEESRPQMPLERIAREEFEGKAREGLTAISDAERECQNGICPVK